MTNNIKKCIFPTTKSSKKSQEIQPSNDISKTKKHFPAVGYDIHILYF